MEGVFYYLSESIIDQRSQKHQQ